ncbi:hypothetical protein LDG_5429 [Legionella drancourtii LLAP12]|uniref:Uncharacterized protein n=1 Tax=Legionella drancourtii LLAP12 TaxID=658187 RepID=G9EJR3_9GAMM|nr:hypothetical protein LDG_5429 [Legionella drancourtii LLAP12]
MTFYIPKMPHIANSITALLQDPTFLQRKKYFKHDSQQKRSIEI